MTKRRNEQLRSLVHRKILNDLTCIPKLRHYSPDFSFTCKSINLSHLQNLDIYIFFLFFYTWSFQRFRILTRSCTESLLDLESPSATKSSQGTKISLLSVLLIRRDRPRYNAATSEIRLIMAWLSRGC